MINYILHLHLFSYLYEGFMSFETVQIISNDYSLTLKNALI